MSGHMGWQVDLIPSSTPHLDEATGNVNVPLWLKRAYPTGTRHVADVTLSMSPASALSLVNDFGRVLDELRRTAQSISLAEAVASSDTIRENLRRHDGTP
ncbi:hypothetical protein IHE55_23340 [Streptomyces pactum]|uniref:Uncharacterized protein n=1 Tax=Streptomyces pactum TaxID=68249 RepID=A0ABS0NQR1_9ACTN|nr:hypothetical protein [Streptomyces pactum]MBH5337541.1 hypothetical protein [Streptomyces pactum]